VKVSIFGATGEIGSHVVQRLLQAGHQVTALVRDPGRLPAGVAERVRWIEGELTDETAVDRTVVGSDAVIWAVGPTSNTPDQPALFEAAAAALVGTMKRHRVRRLIALSGAGVTMPGEQKPLMGRFVSWLVARAVRYVVASKEREREIFTRSGPRMDAGSAAAGHPWRGAR
jgi:putative NADH-flavin reductase